MNKIVIDVDNPNYKPPHDPISSHSKISKLYKFRPYYLDKFFEISSDKLNLSSNNSILLDLCCGRGELASRFCTYANEIYAIDGSKEMLDNNIKKNNITYLQQDINKENLKLSQKVDHIVIGSAIQWIKQESLQKIINENLKENGSFLISHTLINLQEQEYYQVIKNINQKYGKNTENSIVDLWGKKKMHKCNYVQTDGMRLIQPITFDIDYLIYNQLSYAYENFYDGVTSNINSYKKDFFDALLPYAENGKLKAKLINWAIIYTPLKSSRNI